MQEELGTTATMGRIARRAGANSDSGQNCEENWYQETQWAELQGKLWLIANRIATKVMANSDCGQNWKECWGNGQNRKEG